jgi:hypothetical protein
VTVDVAAAVVPVEPSVMAVEPSRPDPLAAFGFNGAFAECARRTVDGPWCEWRVNVRHLSLLYLMQLADQHAAEVHGG